MKRSSPNVFYVSPSDFDLALRGVKTASTRLGLRPEWPQNHHVNIVDNTDESRRMMAIITYNVPSTLNAITETQAYNVGGYTAREHWVDFTNVYPESDGDTVLTLVGFRIV